MCVECGCGLPAPTSNDGAAMNDALATVGEPQMGVHGQTAIRRQIAVQQSILAANDQDALANRARFRAHGLIAVNVLSAPGSGKTQLLTKTIQQLAPIARAGVIVGDLETDNDAQRLRASGAPVVQITTGAVCHLDAQMIARAAAQLNLASLDVLFVENVGNLVCPADFDLGEDLRVVLLSVTEGEDKPLKYPPIFRFADVVIVSKIDLAEAVQFDRTAALAAIRRVNPLAALFEVSARTNQGMAEWCAFLAQLLAHSARQAFQPTRLN